MLANTEAVYQQGRGRSEEHSSAPSLAGPIGRWTSVKGLFSAPMCEA